MTKTQINAKSLARIAAIQTLYQFGHDCDIDDIETELLEIINFYKDPTTRNDYDTSSNIKLKLRPSYNYLKKLVRLSYNNLQEIDIIITEHLTGKWTLANLSKLLITILRVAICEIKYFTEIPYKVSINEYTSIANDMLNANEVGFVNAVLDTYTMKRNNIASDSL